MLRCVSTSSTVEPITLGEIKDLLRIDDESFDAQLPLLISTAREVVERQTGWALVTADYEWTPIGDRRTPLPLLPAQLTSDADAYPLEFSTVPGPIPPPLKIAIALLVGEMIKNPEASVSERVTENPAFQRAIWPYRRMDM